MHWIEPWALRNLAWSFYNDDIYLLPFSSSYFVFKQFLRQCCGEKDIFQIRQWRHLFTLFSSSDFGVGLAAVSLSFSVVENKIYFQFIQRRYLHAKQIRHLFTLFSPSDFGIGLAAASLSVSVRESQAGLPSGHGEIWVGLRHKLISNNIDRPIQPSLPLSKWTSLSSEWKVGWFCRLKNNCTVSDFFVLFLVF